MENECKSSKLTDLLMLSLRVFKVNPFRTSMTILGIGVSFATIFFLISLGYGLQHILLDQIASDTSLRSIDVTTSNAAALPLTESAVERMRALPDVDKVDPIILTSGQIEMSGILADSLVQSASAEVLKTLGLKVLEGKLPNGGGNGIAISNALDSLMRQNGGSLLGQKVIVTSYVSIFMDGIQQVNTVVHPEEYTIEAIFEEGQNVALVPFQKAATLGLPYGLVKVIADNTENLPEIRAGILALGFSTSALADTITQANQIFKIFRIVLALIGLGALVVAIIGMVNTMTISLLERLHEIGIMKIFGITKADMEKLFFLESSIVGFLGGASGLLMGFVFSRIFNLVIGFLANTLGGRAVNLFYYPSWFVFSILIFSAIVGFLVGISPAREASRLDPLKALKLK